MCEYECGGVIVCVWGVNAKRVHMFECVRAGLRTTNAAAVVRVPYSLFIVSRYQGTVAPTGTLLHSQDRDQQFGLTNGGTGWYNAREWIQVRVGCACLRAA